MTLSKELIVAIRPQERLLTLIWVRIFPTFGIYSYITWIRSKEAVGSASASDQLLIVAGLLSAGCMLFHFPRIQHAFVAGLELAEFDNGLHRD